MTINYVIVNIVWPFPRNVLHSFYKLFYFYRKIAKIVFKTALSRQKSNQKKCGLSQNQKGIQAIIYVSTTIFPKRMYRKNLEIMLFKLFIYLYRFY
ncbi:hypothetical protein BY458DRAFT_510286 [Sporodiniella umbellata]|nr:hypothetical protein BY458DRAFT_510286 [Sporodiniella umbellata]